MAGRPEDWMVDVELVEDDGSAGSSRAPEGGEGGAGQEPPDAPGVPRGRGWFADHGGRLVVAGVVGVLVVAAVALVIDLAGGRDDPTTGVRFDSPPTELWSTSDEVLGRVDGVAVLDAGDAVRGVDEVTGVERWAVAVGGDGPVDGCAAVTADPGTVWCWHSRRGVPDAETGATRLRPAGLVGLSVADGAVVVEYAEGLPSAGFVAVGADLVIGERRDATLTLTKLEPHAWAAEWSVDVELQPGPALGQYSAGIEAVEGLVVVRGPTVAVVDPADGEVLAWWPPVDDGSGTDVDGAGLVVTEHGFAASTERADGVRLDRGTWYTRDGRLRASFEGVLAEPEVSDGSESGVLLVARSGAETLVGVDASSGEDLWTFPLEGGATLVRHGGTVVVVGREQVTCLELLAGTRLWEAPVFGLRSDAGGLSDGRVVVVMSLQGREWMMTGLDVATGERLWFADAPGAPALDDGFIVLGPHLELVEGRPVVRAGHEVTWIG
jgi:outer membrane protein assembly factor BamB